MSRRATPALPPSVYATRPAVLRLEVRERERERETEVSGQWVCSSDCFILYFLPSRGEQFITTMPLNRMKKNKRQKLHCALTTKRCSLIARETFVSVFFFL